MDTIRQKILIKWNHRKKVAKKLEGKILPHILEKLRDDNYNLDIEVITVSHDGVVELCVKGGSALGLWSAYLTKYVPVGFGRGQESHASMQ